jgi:hypothetical protein
MLARAAHRARLRKLLLDAHPEWRGRLWINKESVTVRGLGCAWVYPGDTWTPEHEARNVLFEFDDMIEQMAKPLCPECAGKGCRSCLFSGRVR